MAVEQKCEDTLWREMTATGTHIVISRNPPNPLELSALDRMDESELLAGMHRKMNEMQSSTNSLLQLRMNGRYAGKCS